MKKISSFWISQAIGLILGYAGICRILNASDPAIIEQLRLPAGFPSIRGLQIIWLFLFILWGAGSYWVYSVRISPRRKRNIFLNSLILIIGIAIWNYLLFGSVNLSGLLAVCIAILLLGIVVWFMYLVTHRYGGYLFTPLIIWLLFILYLSITLRIQNG